LYASVTVVSVTVDSPTYGKPVVEVSIPAAITWVDPCHVELADALGRKLIIQDGVVRLVLSGEYRR